MDSKEYLSILNDAQKQAVVHEGKSLLILAGAGSGKTRVITTKIAYLIQEKHVAPSSILAVTFTKKASQEMKERAAALEEKSQFAQIRTFHSFGSYFLRLYYDHAGLDKNFTVYDDDDVITLLSKACPNLTRQQCSKVCNSISRAKDYCLSPDSLDLPLIDSDPRFPEYYAAYEKKLRSTGNVDFGDLIMLPYLILKNNPKVRSHMQYKFKVIMVDEYQDSNVAQFLLLKELVGREDGSNTYVCVVGDDDQSIYKFRGAEIQNILNFKKEFPGTDLIRLEENYRSSQEILDNADSVVRNNSNRLGKTLISVKGNGKKPVLVFLPTQDDETQFTADLIQNAYAKGVPYSSWAVLYRMNAQSLGFETEFLHRKIPYKIMGSLRFYQREEIKDILAWLSFLANPKDEVAFRRIVNKPARGVGPTSQDKIIDNIPVVCAATILESAKQVELSKKAKKSVDEFCNLCEGLIAKLPLGETDAVSYVLSQEASLESPENVKAPMMVVKSKEKKLSDFVAQVIQLSGLENYYKTQDEETNTQKVNNMQELVNSAVLYEYSVNGLLDFLDHIELDRTLEGENEDENKDAVTLITLHNTKGLEFDRVIITGLEYGTFPRENKFGDDLEEERRLFYVGITRARNELYYTSCSLRRMYGRSNYVNPSPFLAELKKNQIRVLGQVPFGFKFNNED